jgi:hypothetical protein
MSSPTPDEATAKPPERVQVPCPACKQTTWHEVLAEIQSVEDDPPWWSSELYQVVRCCGCEYHSFRSTYEDLASDSKGEPPLEMLFPPRDQQRALLKGWTRLPVSVARVYQETNTAVSGAQPVLAAVGIRALVEAVCRHRRARGRNLKQRIDNLVTRGVITKAQARVLHKTRFLGNKAAHETVPADDRVLGLAMQIAEHMLTSVYMLKTIGRQMGVKTKTKAV